MEEAMQHVMETENKVVENGVASGASADPPVEGQVVTENNDNDAEVAVTAPAPADNVATPDTPSEDTTADTPVQNGTHAEDNDNDDNVATPDTPSEDTTADTPVQNG